ncbi:hypothetical protein SKAU_G00114360 [Synaphobranchus kaupii]|uniref:Uncharacterized protein n=1 Tax=Synaphobranchus kaupii TaxID=118154 RepID=A0A9Q1G0Y9_SYNKA|nr:hypothetical protein SKAU_G00114360 [Synaphobranchus kaupii]
MLRAITTQNKTESRSRKEDGAPWDSLGNKSGAAWCLKNKEMKSDSRIRLQLQTYITQRETPLRLLRGGQVHTMPGIDRGEDSGEKQPGHHIGDTLFTPILLSPPQVSRLIPRNSEERLDGTVYADSGSLTPDVDRPEPAWPRALSPRPTHRPSSGLLRPPSIPLWAMQAWNATPGLCSSPVSSASVSPARQGAVSRVLELSDNPPPPTLLPIRLCMLNRARCNKFKKWPTGSKPTPLVAVLTDSCSSQREGRLQVGLTPCAWRRCSTTRGAQLLSIQRSPFAPLSPPPGNSRAELCSTWAGRGGELLPLPAGTVHLWPGRDLLTQVPRYRSPGPRVSGTGATSASEAHAAKTQTNPGQTPTHNTRQHSRTQYSPT